MRYKGYYFDEETGFYYCKSRYYVPEWCRWLNADNPSYLKPYSATGNNLFAYCSNDPVNKIDDTGCFAISLSVLFTTVAISAIIGGSISYYSSQKSGDTKKEKLFKTLSGAALGGMYGLSTGLGAMLVTGGTIAGLSAGASFAVGLGVSLGGSALLGAANSFINQTIDNDWDLNAIDGNVIAHDSIVATIKGAVSFASGAWTGAAGLWNIPKGAAPGALNLIKKIYLNVSLGTLWRLSIDLVYSGIKKGRD